MWNGVGYVRAIASSWAFVNGKVFMVKVFMVAKVFKSFMSRQARSAGFMRSASFTRSADFMRSAGFTCSVNFARSVNFAYSAGFTRSAGFAYSAGFMRCESSVMSCQYSKSPHYPRTRI